MSNLSSVENQFTPPLLQAGYDLRRGWDSEVANQLVTLSQQSHIREYTPNDIAKRFSSEPAAEAWYTANKRVVYTIAHTAVAGLVWFGASTSEHIEGDYTFAIRMYEESQGKGLARPFMQAAHADFREHMNYDGAIWLDTDINNERAVKLYENVGYVKRQVTNGRFIMTQSLDR